MDQNFIIGMVMVVGFLILAGWVVAYRTRQNDEITPPPREFLKPPQMFKPSPSTAEITCLQCHTVMSQEQTKCPQCGWSWELAENKPEIGTMNEPTECLECSELIPAGESKCSKCGWSWTQVNDK